MNGKSGTCSVRISSHTRGIRTGFLKWDPGIDPLSGIDHAGQSEAKAYVQGTRERSSPPRAAGAHDGLDLRAVADEYVPTKVAHAIPSACEQAARLRSLLDVAGGYPC